MKSFARAASRFAASAARATTAFLFALLVFSQSQAQTFYTAGGTIPNNTTGTCFPITVSGVGSLSPSNGVVRVCLSATQARPADLDIFLRKPDGTTVMLSTDNGGTSGNDYYTGLCFSDCGPSGSITLGSDFRGVYSPESALSTLNSGGSADGVWSLCIDDDNALGTSGTLNYWSLTFGSPTPPTTPTGETCPTAYVLNSLPYSHTCMTLAGTANNYTGACTGAMDGSEYLFSYTPSASDEYLSIDIAQDFAAPSGFPTVTLLDACPSVAMPVNCIQSEIQFNSTENILHITSQPLTAGTTYYIVVASTSGTGGVYDVRIASGKNGNEDCLQATVINSTGEYAGNNYGANDPNLQAPNTTEMACNGSIDNFVFYTFTTDALGSAVYVHVTDIACDLSCGGACGIQLALFQRPAGGACLGPGSWGAPVHCEASTETNVYYNWTGLLPNTQYYLMVDGNAGSQCVWNLRVLGNFVQPLPVDFINLSVKNENGINTLSWETANEEEVKEYDVEYAETIPAFSEIGMVNAGPDAQPRHSYQFEHAVTQPGWHYYRIRNRDLNGGSAYSKIVSVNVQPGEDFFTLSPNPAAERLTVQFTGKSAGALSICDLNGREVLMEQLVSAEGFTSRELNIAHLPGGLYLLRLLRTDGTVLVKRFSKL